MQVLSIPFLYSSAFMVLPKLTKGKRCKHSGSFVPSRRHGQKTHLTDFTGEHDKNHGGTESQMFSLILRQCMILQIKETEAPEAQSFLMIQKIRAIIRIRVIRGLVWLHI